MLRVLFCIIVLVLGATGLFRTTRSRIGRKGISPRYTRVSEWEEFAKSQAHGRRLDIQFKAETNSIPQTCSYDSARSKRAGPCC